MPSTRCTARTAMHADLDFATLDPARARAAIPRWLAGHITNNAAAERVEAELVALFSRWSDAQVAAQVDCVAHASMGEHARDAEPTCRLVSRTWAHHIALPGDVTGLSHLRQAAAAGPTLVLCNHLSYIDTTGTDAILHRSGASDLADRLVALAGPKVYDSVFRSYATSCLNTLPTPQSSAVTGASRSEMRALLRRALASIRSAAELMAEGRILLLYAEGTRSRTGRLQPFLKAVARYLDVPDLRVVPMASWGSERIMPIGGEQITPAPMHLHIAPSFAVAECDGVRGALSRGWTAIAEHLPDSHAPLPDTEPLR
ncbi:MAG TPA: hypothetical protein DFR83_28200 [Deltaproteobacteria bacterium]|nr:hypothetical protein [Deltaproteobacteria bacterium]